MNGNIITKNIVISNIDKVAPLIYGIVEDKIYNNEVSITVRDELSGISKILIEKDGESKEYSSDKDIELSENGKYKITALDNSGNVTTMHFEINIIEDSKKDIVLDDKEEIIDYEEPDDEGTLPKEEGGGQYVEDKQVDTKAILNNDTTTTKKILPNTGKKSILIFIAIFMIISTIMYIKLKKYKDVK